MELEFIVKDNKYKNINQILKKEFNISSRLLVKLINNKKVLLNGISVDTRNSIKIGDIITVLLDIEENNSNIVPTKMNLDIIYEDEYLLLINKPSGIPVHPSILHFKDSLSNGVKWYYDSIGLNKKIRAVNRIDFVHSKLLILNCPTA